MSKYDPVLNKKATGLSFSLNKDWKAEDSFFKAAIRQKLTGDQLNDPNSSIDNYICLPHGKGRPLSREERSFFEPTLGYNFSKVRLHTDTTANESAESIHALAYTHGNDIVFGPNQYRPYATEGKKLLAHELVHTIQQKKDPAIQRNGKDIQRKQPIDEARKAVKLFNEDFKNAFSSYVSAATISVTYDDKQKATVKAVKAGKDIKVTLGNAYLHESDDNTRWSLIKTEVIDQYIHPDRFEDLAHDPTHSKLHEINPPYMAGHYCELNCPATAASLSEYLKTGKINKAYCNPLMEGGKGYGFDISKNTFSKSFSWKSSVAQIKKQLKKHGDFVVVEARRSHNQMKNNNLSEYHYFTVVNVKGKLFAIDAFGGGIVNDDLKDYIDNSIIATSYRLVKGQFKVKPVMLP